jgi:mannose-1-phosphate guanylyltransferase / phosphomannomutase
MSAAKRPVRAMVMAAGAGTRLRPLTFAVPKPMVPIANRPVLEYTIEHLKRHGIQEVVLNLHSHPDMIRSHFGDGSAFGMRIRYSAEPELLGTAGGVKKMEEFLGGGSFLVMSGDGLTSVNLRKLLRFHRAKRSLGTMGLQEVNSRFEYGVTKTSPSGRIARFYEKPSWGDVFSNEVNTGIYVFEPRIFAFMPKGKTYDFGRELWPLLLRRKEPIFGFPVKDYWCDVGSLGEYRRAQRDMLDRKVGFALPGQEITPGVWMEEGAVVERTAKIEGPCLIGKGARIGADALVGPYTVIGHRTEIGPEAVIRASTLWNDVRVGTRVRLENCIVTHTTSLGEGLNAYDAALVPAVS